jgi:hypothetical protein
MQSPWRSGARDSSTLHESISSCGPTGYFRQLRHSVRHYRSYLFTVCIISARSRDNSVGIATRYGLDGLGIESRWWGARFSSPDQTGSEAHPASYTMGTGSFPGVKRPGRGVDHPPLSRAEAKERVELYICSPSWPVLGRTLPVLLLFQP